MKCLCYSWLSLCATAEWLLTTWFVLWKIPDAHMVWHAATIPKPTMLPFCCLLPFVSTYLFEQRGGHKRRMKNSHPGSTFSQRFRRYPLRVLHLFFCLALYQSSTAFSLKWPNKLSQFDHNVQKGKVVNTVSRSLVPIARKTTKKSQQEKTGVCTLLLNNL